MSLEKREIQLGIVETEDTFRLVHRGHCAMEDERYHIVEIGCDEEVFERILESIYLYDRALTGEEHWIVDIAAHEDDVVVTNGNVTPEIVAKLVEMQLAKELVEMGLVTIHNTSLEGVVTHTVVYKDTNGILQPLTPDVSEDVLALLLPLVTMDGCQLTVSSAEVDEVYLQHFEAVGLTGRLIAALTDPDVMTEGYEKTLIQTRDLVEIGYRHEEITYHLHPYMGEIPYALLSSDFLLQDGVISINPATEYPIAMGNVPPYLRDNMRFYKGEKTPTNLTLLFLECMEKPIIGYIDEDGECQQYTQETLNKYVDLLESYTELESGSNTVRLGVDADGNHIYGEQEYTGLSYLSEAVKFLATHVENMPCRLLKRLGVTDGGD